MRNRFKGSDMPNEDELEQALLDVVTQQTNAPLPVKQVIMYHVNDEDPNRLYTLARLEDETIDKIARRVVELMDERKGKKK